MKRELSGSPSWLEVRKTETSGGVRLSFPYVANPDADPDTVAAEEQRKNTCFTVVAVVREVFVIHVGCTRYVTSSTDNNLKIHARITLNVEFIRTCIFIFLFDVYIQ